MKLSASSRDYVTKQVKEAFAEEIRKADKAAEDAENARKAKFAGFKKELDEALLKWMAEFEDLRKKYGFRWAQNRGPKNGANVRVFDSNSVYDPVDIDSFAETADRTECEKAYGAVRALRNDVENAVQKALFEIEVHGQKSTLQEIVDQVIREAKEGKEGK